ncbi:MAG: nucleotidyltransferase domain-containing protein [Bacteroidia bacterium]|nr:nucleotidyltransferase domain-containing protein [Bacteroidia bacterium]
MIIKILNPYNPTMVGIFGSYARSQESKNSDIDILIDLNEKFNLLDLIGIEQKLSDTLNRKIDLITVRSLNEQIKPYILKDIVRLI